MPKHKNKHSPLGPLVLAGLGLVVFVLVITWLLQGTNVALLNSKGMIASQQRTLIIYSVMLMLVIGIPALTLLYFTAWKYRASNSKSTYHPTARTSKVSVIGMWAVPTVFMIVLALVMWPATHELEPRKTIASDARPITIKVIALRWKWLFLYPEQQIATVNFVNIPEDTPVTFELTADEAPMSSFWIPNLSGQLYAMTGHVNHLNMIGNIPGDYPGMSAEINGAGFAGMKFTARVSSAKNFDIWVQRVKQSQDTLDTTTYENLVLPSEYNSTAFYSDFENNIYDKVISKYTGSHDHQPASYEVKH
jgi:cytochrome o ubiquinol oxidase subunit 2